MKKKKFLCFFLVLMLCFSSTISAYASSGSRGGGGTSFGESEKESSSGGEHGGGGLTFNSDEEKHTFAYNLGQFLMKSALVPADIVVGGVDAIGDFVQSKLDYWNEKGWLGMSGGKLYFSGSATKDINSYLQNAVREYDGYYLIVPCADNPVDSIVKKYDYSYEQEQTLLSLFSFDSCNVSVWYSYPKKYLIYPKDTLFYIDQNTAVKYKNIKSYEKDAVNVVDVSKKDNLCISEQFASIYQISNGSDPLSSGFSLTTLAGVVYGSPFKVFKNYYSVTKYLSNGRSYLPEFPADLYVPKKYIDDPTLLPDITYNIDKSNKTENMIQNEYNAIINNYITNLGGSSSGGSSGGDSGNTGGGSSGGSSGGGSNITDTELYDFLTKLWNESDKKFDKMIDLLETNNKYQKKLVDSLNDIKAILVTEAVFNAFKDRSSQTADKAKDKFPTSIPWDVAIVINAMSAEPEQLKFSLPIQVKSIGINETIDIDLSSEEWEKLAKTCRYLLSLTFILFLIHLTRKMFGGGDD